MSSEFDEIMQFDAFVEAEKITGLSYKDDEATSDLGMALFFAANSRRKDELALRNDTYYGMPFVDAVKIYEEHGFKTVYEETFVSKSKWSSGAADTFKIMWRDGILLTCESYENKTLNNASMCYNWVANDDKADEISHFISSGFCFETKDGKPAISGDHNVREGFVHNLSKLDANGTFLSTWEDAAWLWLVNYTEEEDYKDVNARKFALLPAEIQEALKVCFES